MSENDLIKLLSINSAASKLGLGKDSVYRLVETGKLGYIQIGKRKKISYQEIIRFITESTERNPLEGNIKPEQKNQINKKTRISQHGHAVLEKLMEQ